MTSLLFMNLDNSITISQQQCNTKTVTPKPILHNTKTVTQVSLGYDVAAVHGLRQEREAEAAETVGQHLQDGTIASTVYIRQHI
jgi:hypothetical protein